MSKSNATSLVGVDRTHGNLTNTKTMRHGFAKQVVRISVSFPQRVPADGLQGVTVDRNVTALRIAETHRQSASREPRKHVVTHPARKRHLSAGRRPRETVPLHEIGSIVDERAQDVPQASGRHLTIGCHDDRHVGPTLGCTLASGCDGSADTEIGRVRHEVEPARTDSSRARRAIRAAVIDDDDLIDVGRNPL